MPDVPDVPDKTNAPGPRGDAAATRIAEPPTDDAATREDPAEVPGPDDLDIEAAEADIAEQRTAVMEEDDDGGELGWTPVPDGVDPADRTDQQRVVSPDEDEYR